MKDYAMRNMTKKIFALLLTVALLISVAAACTDNELKPVPTADAAKTEGPADATVKPSETEGSPEETPEGTPAVDPGEETKTPDGSGDPDGSEKPVDGSGNPSEDPSEGTPDASVDPDDTASPGSTGGQPTATSGPAVTEKPTENQTEKPTANPKGPRSATDVTFDADDALKYFTGANAAKAELVSDSEYGRVVKISTTGKSGDPFINFNYRNYMNAYKLTPASADTYKVVALKIRQEKCSNSTFELFYCAGSITAATGGYSRSGSFDNSDGDWQYIIFDLTTANGFKGIINAFRFDFMTSSVGANESVIVGEVILAKNVDEVITLMGGGKDLNALSAADQKKAENLINSAKEVAPAVSNTKLNAANEDGEITLWFDHAFAKTPDNVTTSTGKNTYQIRMARNEIEDCQFILASTKAKSGLTASLTEFTDGSGNKLTGEILEGYYFDNVEGKNIVDPIPPLKGSFDLKAGKSKTFIIKVRTAAGTKAGQYSAVLTIKDSGGREVKKANVYVYVWNFTLPEASSCKILADLSWHNIYSYNPPWLYNGDDSLTYSKYYDYLLENKVNAYTLPYMSTEGDNPFTDSRVNKYLDDPRVQAFNPVTYGTQKVTEARVRAAYTYLSQKPAWLEKAYFYPVDEPVAVKRVEHEHTLDELKSLGRMIQNIFGNKTKIIAPMHINQAMNSTSTEDAFSYVADVVNVWCPHTYFFNTLAEYKNDPKLMFQYYTALLEKNLGSFKSRMAKEQAGGDEVWWYVTRFPHHPEITLSIDDHEVEHRLLFWQQKLYNVDGFLYYLVNDWNHGDVNPWNKKHEQNNSYPYNVYGNGVLVYNGFEDSEGMPYQSRDRYNELADKSYNAYPVGSMRLESVRDGAEDFDYFTILDKLYGAGTSDLVIKQITTSLGNYKVDGELYNRLRIAVGNLIAAKS